MLKKRAIQVTEDYAVAASSGRVLSSATASSRRSKKSGKAEANGSSSGSSGSRRPLNWLGVLRRANACSSSDGRSVEGIDQFG